MSTSAGLRLLPSLNWMASGSEDPFPLFIERLAAFIALVNANPGNHNHQLTILRTHLSSLAQLRRGLVLKLGGPTEDWIWFFIQPTSGTDHTAATYQGGVSTLYADNTSNDGYGALAAGSQADQRLTLSPTLNASAAAAFEVMTPQSGPSAVLYAQDTTPGREWFVFNGDAAAAPMATHLNPNPWTFFLGREERTARWMALLRRLNGLVPSSNGRYGLVTDFSPLVQVSLSAQAQKAVSRAQLHLRHLVQSSAGFWSLTLDRRPSALPPPIWFGPCVSDPLLFPERAHFVHGRIVLAGHSYFQLGRAVDPDWWIRFPTTALPPAAAGWTAFSDFPWRSRSHALVLHEYPLTDGATALLSHPSTTRSFTGATQILRHRLMRQAGEALLAEQGVVIESAGPSTAQRPSAGVLWPRWS